jgi:hypothetical protein
MDRGGGHEDDRKRHQRRYPIHDADASIFGYRQRKRDRDQLVGQGIPP